jgi:formate dehydrogenase major subunit
METAGLVVIVGANPAENHPVLATRIKRSHKHRGQRLIVADLRKHEMAERADIFFRPNPSTDSVWMCAMAKYIIDSGLAKMDFIDKWVNNFDEFKKSLESFTLEYAEQITGVPVATLTTVAHEIAAADGVVFCLPWV